MADELTDEQLIEAALSDRDGEEVEQTEGTDDVTDTDVGETPSEDEEAESGDDTDVATNEDVSDDNENEEVEESSAEPEEDDTKEPDFKPVIIKARGMEIEIKSQQELMDLAHKGFDYFKKTQELSSWRKQIGLLKDGGVSDQEIQRLIDAKKGDKNAIASMAKDYGVDTLDIEDNDNALYKPSEGRSAEQYELDDIASEIQSDSEHANNFSRVANTVPNDFASQVAGNPAMLRSFSGHVKSGLAERIIPEATKAQVQYGGSFMDHYSRIGEAMATQDSQLPPEQRASIEKPQMSEREREMRKRASSPGKSGKQKFSAIDTAEEIWDLNEDEFEAYASKLKG